MSAPMWAYRLAAPNVFEMCEVGAPSPDALAPGRVIVRTAVGGVCGSDLPYFRGAVAPDSPDPDVSWPDRPGFPLHEIVGTVVASRSPHLVEGDQVVGWASGFDGIAQFVETDGDGLWKYDPALVPHEAIVLQPLACVLYALERMRNPRGTSFAVLGLGPIGLLFCHALRTRGAGHIVGVDTVDRADLSEAYGVDEFVPMHSGRWTASLATGDRPDVVIEAVGHQSGTLNHAVRSVRNGGEIYYFGIPDDNSTVFDLRLFLRKNLTLRSGSTRDRRRMLSMADEYVHDHRDLGSGYVTDLLPHTEVQTAFGRAAVPKRGQVKVAIRMTG